MLCSIFQNYFTLFAVEAKKYCVYRNQDGKMMNELCVVDTNEIISWRYVSPIGVNPGVESILKALESLSQENNKDKK